jgi:hypothetical protein
MAEFTEKPKSNLTKGEVSKTEVKPLSPEGVYSYETDTNPENFEDLPFNNVDKSKNDLSPPSPFIPKNSNSKYCKENPSDPKCHDEDDPYTELGFFQETVKHIFDPENRIQKVQKKPVATLYESKRDDAQMDVQAVVRTECRCKDGSVVMGYLDTRTGQKDCSPCKKTNFSNPTIYKNYKTKKKRANFDGKKVPLRKQVGVSSFGDVNMKGCQTGNAEQSLERVNASATLNRVVNTDTIDSVGATKVTQAKSNSGIPLTIYSNCNTNIYGI